MASGSGGLKPRAVAGGPSVTRLTHSRCSGVSGSGRPRRVAKKIVAISPMLHEIRKQMNAYIYRFSARRVDTTPKIAGGGGGLREEETMWYVAAYGTSEARAYSMQAARAASRLAQQTRQGDPTPQRIKSGGTPGEWMMASPGRKAGLHTRFHRTAGTRHPTGRR